MNLSDFRHAARALLRTPSYTLLAMGTLALGIGANTAIFSAVYRLQFRPLPFETADRLVNLARTRADEGFFLSPQPDVVRAWQEHTQTLEHVAMAVTEPQTLSGFGDPVELRAGRVSAELAAMLEVPPLLGRMLTDQDVASDGAVVVLSESLWRRRFGGDPQVVGRIVRIGDRALTVIGVMPARFARYADPYPRADFWVPYVPRPSDFGHALGLMKEGVTPEMVAAELERIAAAVDDEPSAQQAWSYRAMPMADMLVVGSRRILPILLAAVGLVLVIACANVASLMIVRLNARRREIAIRATLGAGSRRILGAIAAEQLLLALAAGAAGLLLAVWTMELIAHLQPNGMPLLDTLALDPAVLLFAGILLAASVVASGIAPAMLVLRRHPGDVLRSGGERMTSGNRLRSVLVSGQIALSVILLVAAMLLGRSYASLLTRDLGFEARSALAVDIALPEHRYTPEQREAFVNTVLDAVRTAPGVTAAAIAGGTPPNMGLLFVSLTVDGSDVATDDISYLSGTAVTPGFLPTLGARFVEGGDLTSEHTGMDAVVVNRAFVERFWPGQHGVGRRLRITASPDSPWTEIVGVVENIRASHGEPDQLQLFYPMEWSYPGHTLLVRTDGRAVLPFIRQAVSRLDPNAPIRDASTLQQRLSESVSRERFVMVLLGVFAVLALLLTIVGLYGLVAYTVQQRVREIGIRVALGASARSVRELFIVRGMRLVAAGMFLGLIGAAASVQVLRSVVHEISVYDSLSFMAAIALIAPAALLASWLPARRTARVDPMVTLRAE